MHAEPYFCFGIRNEMMNWLYSLENIIYFGCAGSLLPPRVFSSLWLSGGYSGCGEWAYHCSDRSLLWSTGSRACSCSMWAQQLWFLGLVAPKHVGSSWTREWTHVSLLVGHWATREALLYSFFSFIALESQLSPVLRSLGFQMHWRLGSWPSSPPWNLQASTFPPVYWGEYPLHRLL